ncbi:hypothetical protein [Sphingorhabdus lacus]|uniref:Uncharacterized protein n=1 Tax=Sphingorhabdus lacus TaxID=392610 RepID=A0A6I6L4W4_9SPHN|nr:hypothetical protein [Sphingorhabdus lacus]QGY80759.1 hypothetical protein EUU25_09100 [Sphingorhabdus lacus]
MDNKPVTFEDREPSDAGRQWSGFAEIDQAIAENRLTEYRLRKSWSDPFARRLGIVIAIMFAGFAAFVIIQDVF